MSDAAKKAMEKLEANAPSMTETDLAYITGYADGAAASNARDSSEESEADQNAEA